MFWAAKLTFFFDLTKEITEKMQQKTQKKKAEPQKRPCFGKEERKKVVG